MEKLFKIDLQRVTLETGPNDVYLLLVNGEVIFSGTRQQCVDAAYQNGCSPKALRYTDQARTVITAKRYRLMKAKRDSGKQISAADERFLARYAKHFN